MSDTTDTAQETPVTADEIAAVLNLPQPRPPYDANMNLKVYASDMEFARLYAQSRGLFTELGKPNVTAALREAWDDIVAKGRVLFEQGQEQLQKTGT